jgi:hypothetical protein
MNLTDLCHSILEKINELLSIILTSELEITDVSYHVLITIFIPGVKLLSSLGFLWMYK